MALGSLIPDCHRPVGSSMPCILLCGSRRGPNQFQLDQCLSLAGRTFVSMGRSQARGANSTSGMLQTLHN